MTEVKSSVIIFDVGDCTDTEVIKWWTKYCNEHSARSSTEHLLAAMALYLDFNGLEIRDLIPSEQLLPVLPV